MTLLAAARRQRRGHHTSTDDCVAPHVPGGAHRHMQAWGNSLSTPPPGHRASPRGTSTRARGSSGRPLWVTRSLKTARCACGPDGWATMDEDTLELASRFDLGKVHQCMRSVGLRVEDAVAVVESLA